MTKKNMTPDEEHAYYANPDNQTPQGPPVRRRAKLSEPVPVRLPEETLTKVRNQAAADDRSVSSWIRRAIEHELTRQASEIQ
ncbi:Arc family DNA-binding protein [Auritidibacter ignavus]|uniref:ribbon-helix-helix protein, CopG family n=1 Tax=Auritidibacter ignavus TaxID=678932 RepID=UPI0024469039|nr:ribbon-helix-helix protein, CopG family [Auritidibacter ignavus]WGH90307.1 Arc family DNA-binding protein [Auritidibacter ignavus]WGH90333.1 Arc family DNA-binding protein [Auritidibacter ignavus]